MLRLSNETCPINKTLAKKIFTVFKILPDYQKLLKKEYIYEH